MVNSFRIALSVACLTSFVASGEAAFANEPNASGDGVSGEETAYRADTSPEIVVTAQKRSESVQRVAASIAALGSEALQARAVSNAAQLAGQVPGLQAGEYGPTVQFAIRGISLDIKTGAGEPSVATHVDGVYIARPTSPLPDFEDLARVEVLRGPQGTLYGRNSTGGAINFVSAEPTDQFEGAFTIGSGSFNRYLARGWVSLPIAEDKAAIRLTASYDENDGSGRNLLLDKPLDGRKRVYVHGDLRLTPSDVTTIDLGAYYIHEKLNGPQQYVYRQGPLYDFLFPRVIATETTEPRKTYDEVLPLTKREMTLLTARISQDLSDSFTLRSTTGYAVTKFQTQFPTDGTPIPYVRVGYDRLGLDTGNSKFFSEELNLSGRVGPIDLVSGLYFFHENFKPRVPINFPLGIPGAIPPDSSFYGAADESTTSYAAFVDLTAHVTDRLRVVGGMRVSRDKKKYTQTFGLQLPGFAPGQGPGFACSDAHYDDAWNSVTPKAGVQFDVTPSAMVYGQYQKGFKSGQFNLTVCNNRVDPETVNSYEIGWKSRLLDNRVTLNVAGFHYAYSDLQVDRTIPGVPPTSILDNAATAKVDGIELETVIQPDPAVAVNVGITYLNARYGTYLSGLGRDFSGNKLNRAPDWTVKSGAEWRIPLDGVFSRLTIRGELNLTGRTYFDASNSLDTTQSGYVVGNAYLTLDSTDKGLTLRGYVTNLGNVTALTGVIDATASQNAIGSFYNQPRTFGVELTKTF